MGMQSKRKGHGGKQELAFLLRTHLGIKINRNLKQVKVGGYNLKGIPGIVLEVKRTGKPAMGVCWKRTVRQADRVKRVPVLAYRLDRQQGWQFKMALGDVISGFYLQPRAFEMTLDLSLEAFCAVVQERFLVLSQQKKSSILQSSEADKKS